MATKKLKNNNKPKKTANKINGSEGFVLDTINNSLKFIKRNWVVSAIALIAIIALSWLGYVYLIKWQYAKAEKEVTNLSTAIITELGTPKSIDTLKGCSYQSTKNISSDITPACSITLTMKYPPTSIADAFVTANKVQSIIGKAYRLDYVQNPKFIENTLTLESDWSKSNFEIDGFDCSGWTIYSSHQELSIGLSCGKINNFYRIYPEI